MALYFLDYDLRKSRDYQRLYDVLADFEAVHVLESLWAFKRVNTNCAGLRDFFRQFVDADDGLIVSEVVDWAGAKPIKPPPNTD
jgi:hypothetical protein